jgi:hypothetical protein
LFALNSPRRLLWNDPSVVGYCAVTLLTTVAIIAWQMRLRTGILESAGLPIFYSLFLFQDYAGALLFVLVLLSALVPGIQSVATSVARWLGANPLPASVGVSVLLAAGAYWGYQGHPLAMDESAPYMQAQVFASGALVGQVPPELIDWLVYPPFQNYFVHVSHETGRIASAYWPGFALLLTPFMALGVPWLCNPVLGGLSVWTIHRLTYELSSSTVAAGAAVLFTLGSAAFVVNAISFYSMTAHLLCNGLFALMLIRPTVPRAIGAGLIGGLALNLHNPIPHMLFALPWLAWLAVRPDRRSLIPAIALGYLPWIAIVGFGWHHLLQGLGETSAANSSASGANPLAAAVSTLVGVFEVPARTQLVDRIIGLCKLWLWAAPVLVLVSGVGFWQHRHNTFVRLLAASALVTFVAYLFVPLSQGHGWGFRYVHSAWLVMPILAALLATDKQGGSTEHEKPGPSPMIRYALAGALGGLIVMNTFFVGQAHRFIQQHLAQLPTTESGRPRIVIIEPLAGYYAQDLVQNDPFLRAPVIRLVTRGRQDDESMLAQYFPDLILLSRGYRGSVWGYRDDSSAFHPRPADEQSDP